MSLSFSLDIFMLLMRASIDPNGEEEVREFLLTRVIFIPSHFYTTKKRFEGNEIERERGKRENTQTIKKVLHNDLCTRLH